MDRELEYVEACDLCGSPSNRARPLFTKRGLSIVKCPGCGLFYVNPRVPQEVLWQRLSHDCFVDEYLPQSREYDEQANYRFQTPRLLALNGHAPARGRLLDVGCATGLFLAAACMDGWEVTGNELSPFAADYARQHFNVPVAVGNSETIDLLPGSFDAVTM